MNPEIFIEKQLRLKIPDITQAAIDEAIKYYRRSQGGAKGKVFDECVKVAKQHMRKK